MRMVWFTQRRELEQEFLDWAKRHRLAETPFNAITWLVCIKGYNQSNWISVAADKKPKNGEDCLCVCTLPNDPKHEWDWMAVLRWYSNGDNGYVNGPHFQHEGSEGMKVTHWMPLPSAPKEECP